MYIVCSTHFFRFQWFKGNKVAGAPCDDRYPLALLENLIISWPFHFYLSFLWHAIKLVFILRNQIFDFFRVIIDKLLLWILFLLRVTCGDRTFRRSKIALLENCHYVAYIVLILISNYFFSVNIIAPCLRAIIWIFMSILIRDSWNLGLVGVFDIQIIHTILLVSLAILTTYYSRPWSVWKFVIGLTVV